MFESAELSPGGLKFAGHSEKLHAKIPDVSGGHRIMIVSPSAGRQGFKFQMAEIGKNFPVADRDMS